MNGPGAGRYHCVVELELLVSDLDCPVIDETSLAQKNIHTHLSVSFYRVIFTDLSPKPAHPLHHKLKIDRDIIRGFDTSVLTKENHTDVKFMEGWLASELDTFTNVEFDETDVFSINTVQIKRSMGLNKTELAILRFACLINCYKPLDGAADICGCTFTEVDLCDLLAELLLMPFDAVYDALHPSGLLRKS